MGKVSGSYESVVRGVSQQVAQDRRSGQHAEQVNMVSDPVRGLARRHGSMLQDEQLTPGGYTALLADTVRHNVLTFYVGGVPYDLIYRTTASALGQTGFAWAFNRATAKFLPISYASNDPVLDALVSGGVSSGVNIGKYLFLAGNAIVPTWQATDNYGASGNQALGVAWVRGGAYSRTFRLTVILTTGATVVAIYKTVSSSYPDLLDTSDIPVYKPGTTTVDPEYQKKVNDRVYAYNSASAAWVGTAAADITPENIAQKLVDALNAQGVPTERVGSSVCITHGQLAELSADDGGDGSLLRAVGNQVTAPDLVSAVHYAGKIVKVRPSHSNGDNAFYLKATPKIAGSGRFTEVTWNEAAGYSMQPTSVFVLGTVSGGTLYLASSADRLTAIAGGTHPKFLANAVGDQVTCPLPHLFGNRISFLGVFQDRLVIGSGAVLLFSKPGDYLNWFRTSVLTVADNDPWEGFALGAEDDTITSATTFDRNLVLHGSRFWYAVNGRQPFTPKTASIATASAYPMSNTAAPAIIGNFTMYAKFSGIPGDEVASLHQVQAGVVTDSPETVDISQQLDDYLRGKPVQVVPVSSPNTVFLRTERYRTGLYTYGYLDSASSTQRLLDNWSRWSWDERLGQVVGVSAAGSDLLVYLLRQNAGFCWIAAERFTLHSALSDYPYADSLRRLGDTAYSGYIRQSDAAFADAVVAFEQASNYRFRGDRLENWAVLTAGYPVNQSELWVGLPFSAYVTPTNPFIRDRDGQAVLAGRLTLGRVGVTVENTGGAIVTVASSSGEHVSDYSGRVLGGPSATIGRTPIVSTSVSVPVGKEVRECSYTIAAKSWLPLTITTVEWTGQSFNNVRRV